MTMSIALAAASGFTGVLGAWQGLAALQARDLRGIAAPLRFALGSGLEPTAAQRRHLVLVAGGCLFAAGYLIAGVWPALMLVTCAPVAASAAIRLARERWRRELAAGAPAAARAIADALSGGHSVMGAVGMAAREHAVTGAAGRELAAAARAVALGADPDAALAAVARRSGASSWDLIAAALSLQRRAGGDLAGSLRRVAEVADERERSEADARTLTAQARFTARLVAAMPLAGAVLGEVVMPGSLASVVSSPVSLALVSLAAVVLFVSFAAIGRIARPPR